MIRLEGVSKSFGALAVLRDVSLQIDRAERVAIIGASGAGKSVLLRTINLLERPDAGKVFIDGEEITARGAPVDAIRRKMGMVYQQFNLFSHMNVLDNLTLAPMRLLKLHREEAESRARALLRMVSLESKADAWPDSLSGGQKQRIAIARCLSMEPKILLFDEPTSALDPTMVGEVLATIRMLARREMTMLIVTHEMGFAREVATRVLYMDEMGIYEQGTPEEIFERPKRARTQAFIRKLKNLDEHITRYDFDLISLQSRINLFCWRYNVERRRANALALATEELLVEALRRAYRPGEQPDARVHIEYAESDGSLRFELACRGEPFNPFSEDLPGRVDLSTEGDVLSYILVRAMAKEITHQYAEGMNRYTIIL